MVRYGTAIRPKLGLTLSPATPPSRAVQVDSLCRLSEETGDIPPSSFTLQCCDVYKTVFVSDL